MKTEVIMEKSGEEFLAYSPSFHGCIVCGKTREETIKNLKDAIEILTGKELGDIITKEKVVLNLDEDLSDLKQLSEISMKRVFMNQTTKKQV